MMFLWLTLVGLLLSQASAKAVFAHFMVSNTGKFSQADWENNIRIAKAAGIDAFALNMARNEETTGTQLPNAFAAANSVGGFQLFFSFDYAGNGPWNKAEVAGLINIYKGDGAYFHRGSQAFVSTFEGPESAADWKDIKRDTDCFFIPDWSSLGAKDALQLGVADGLFSWAAWPTGPRDAHTYDDASYFDFLGGKPYMAPVSPWFYTNMPGFNKNWVWRGDDLWFDRWQQIIFGEQQPEYLQIISWNDFGESHYIGPLDDNQYEAFERGKAPVNYVKGMPHDGWREFLPYHIQMWKEGTSTVEKEGASVWYRLSPASACADGGTTGSTASQLLLEYKPTEIVQDKVFFTAQLGSAADISVSIGGTTIPGTWTTVPAGGVGLYHGSVPMGGNTGVVKVTVSRAGRTIVTVDGEAIGTNCAGGISNFNAWVGSSWGGSISAVSPAKSINQMNCTEGTGANNFAGLCEFTCKYGYCPEASCVCTHWGNLEPEPKDTGVKGYPLPGASPAYIGLCSWACNHGYCPPSACGTVDGGTANPTTSPFLAPSCTKGTGSGSFSGLCDYACNFGFCPTHICSCTTTGPLNVPPPKDASIKAYASGADDDYGLCQFACERKIYCPEPCKISNSSDTLPGGVFHETDPTTSGNTVGYYLRNCDTQQSEKTALALKNVKAMAQAAIDEWWYLGDHGDLAATYLAIPNDGNYKTNKDAQAIKANLERVASIAPSGGWAFQQFIGIHCDDKLNACDQKLEGTNRLKAGQAVHNIGGHTGYGEVGAFEMCPLWFKYTFPPGDVYNSLKDWNDVSLEYLENDAGKLLHEFMHMDMISEDRGHIVDQLYQGYRAYTAPTIAKMVRDGWTSSAMSKNADTYTQFVNAIYFKGRYRRTIPPSNPTAFTETKYCLGDNPNYVLLDNAQKHIQEFCNEITTKYSPNTYGEWIVDYEKGTPEHVSFRFRWNTGGHLMKDEIMEMCQDNMYELLNGCDTNSHTWKHGGAKTYTIKDKNPNNNQIAYDFEVVPWHTRPHPIPTEVTGSCDVYYKVFYDEFYIYGGLWAGKDYGQDKLLGELRKCGVVSEWRFDYYDEPDKYNLEWQAYGRLPIGAFQWGCVREAIVNSGGPAKIGCGGS